MKRTTSLTTPLVRALSIGTTLVLSTAARVAYAGGSFPHNLKQASAGTIAPAQLEEGSQFFSELLLVLRILF